MAMPKEMNRNFRMLTALLLIVAAAYIADIPLSFPSKQPAGSSDWYRVVRVTDGDTIVIDRDGEELPVRLIGIDSPEVDTPYTKAECYGKESSDAARQTMGGREVRIETDPSQDTYDAYGRLLAYVYVPASVRQEGIMVNEYLLREGFARQYTFNTRYAHSAAFHEAEASAKAARKGLWAIGSCAK